MKVYEDIKKAKQTLLENGWVEVCTVMADKNETKNYGIQLTKGNHTFFLNCESIYNLPTF